MCKFMTYGSGKKALTFICNSVSVSIITLNNYFHWSCDNTTSVRNRKTCFFSRLFSFFSRPTFELQGKTLGIFGFGAIGKQVARIALAFDMKVIASTRSKKEFDGVEFVSLDELLERSDFLTVHCPLTPETDTLFDANAFSKMKNGSYFINTARGGVMDETALADALNSGKLAGAAIDVLSKEPMQSDCPLLCAKNVTLTPHIAWAPIETRQRLLGIVCDNVESFINGSPKNKVN